MVGDNLTENHQYRACERFLIGGTLGGIRQTSTLSEGKGIGAERPGWNLNVIEGKRKRKKRKEPSPQGGSHLTHPHGI